MKKQQAPTTYSINADGQRIAHVALTGSSLRANVYADWYNGFIAAGFSACWRLTKDGRGNEYVTLIAYCPTGHSREVPVSRFIVSAKRGECVRTKNGDALNLLDENLNRYRGPSQFDAADWFPNTEALRAVGIEPTDLSRGLRKQKKRKQ